MFACCSSRPKNTKVPLEEQLQFSGQISLNLSELIIATYDSKLHKWTSKTGLFDVTSQPVTASLAASGPLVASVTMTTSAALPPMDPAANLNASVQSSAETAEQRTQTIKLERLKNEVADLERKGESLKKRRDDCERSKLKEQLTLKLVEQMTIEEKRKFEKAVIRSMEV